MVSGKNNIFRYPDKINIMLKFSLKCVILKNVFPLRRMRLAVFKFMLAFCVLELSWQILISGFMWLFA